MGTHCWYRRRRQAEAPAVTAGQGEHSQEVARAARQEEGPAFGGSHHRRPDRRESQLFQPSRGMNRCPALIYTTSHSNGPTTLKRPIRIVRTTFTKRWPKLWRMTTR